MRFVFEPRKLVDCLLDVDCWNNHTNGWVNIVNRASLLSYKPEEFLVRDSHIHLMLVGPIGVSQIDGPTTIAGVHSEIK